MLENLGGGNGGGNVSWPALGVLISVLSMGISGYKAVTKNTVQLAAIQQSVDRRDQERQRDISEIKSDMREMRRLLNNMLKEVRNK